jgi:hypothetical protein
MSLIEITRKEISESLHKSKWFKTFKSRDKTYQWVHGIDVALNKESLSIVSILKRIWACPSYITNENHEDIEARLVREVELSEKAFTSWVKEDEHLAELLES